MVTLLVAWLSLGCGHSFPHEPAGGETRQQYQAGHHHQRWLPWCSAWRAVEAAAAAAGPERRQPFGTMSSMEIMIMEPPMDDSSRSSSHRTRHRSIRVALQDPFLRGRWRWWCHGSKWRRCRWRHRRQGWSGRNAASRRQPVAQESSTRRAMGMEIRSIRKTTLKPSRLCFLKPYGLALSCNHEMATE